MYPKTENCNRLCGPRQRTITGRIKQLTIRIAMELLNERGLNDPLRSLNRLL